MRENCITASFAFPQKALYRPMSAAVALRGKKNRRWFDARLVLVETGRPGRKTIDALDDDATGPSGPVGPSDPSGPVGPVGPAEPAEHYPPVPR